MTFLDVIERIDNRIDSVPTRNDSRVDLKSLLPNELRAFIAKSGKEKFRANQLLRWIHGRGVSDFSEMTDLSKHFRAELETIARIERLREVTRVVSDDGLTVKLLLELSDGNRIETVAMHDGKRRTVCVSSQVGCALGCDFCATGQLGLRRNLTTGEIIDQLCHAADIFRVAGNTQYPISNVVMMGMGEPLHNYDNVIRAVRLMGLEMGLAISVQRVTISTVGLVPQIRRLADDMPRVGLAISLNATTDEVRNELMPINTRWPIAELMDAAHYMSERAARRRVTIEYALIAGVNDSDDDARRLVRLVSRFPCKINIIPFNPVPDRPYRRPSAERIRRFHELLIDRNLTATVRWSKGDDIAAACGQLQARIID